MELANGLFTRAVDRAYDIKLNVAVWMAFKPLLKVYLSIGTGFVLSKTKILTPQLSKGISQLVLLILMPALIFNNIVSHIMDTDIKEFGVVVFSGFIYYTVGLGYGLLLSLVSPIPKGWFGGLLLCCMLNNCSDLPLAYVQAIGQSPVLPSSVATVGQAYCVLIVIIFIIFNFNLGGSRLVEWDATRDEPHPEEPTVPILTPTGLYTWFKEWRRKKFQKSASASNEHSESEKDTKNDLEDQESTNSGERNVPYVGPDDAEMPMAGKTLTTQSMVRASRERIMSTADAYYAFPRRDSDDDGESIAPIPIGADDPVAYQNMSILLSQRDQMQSAERTTSHQSLAKPKSKWQRFKRRWRLAKEKNFATRYCLNFLEDIFVPQMLALIAAVTVCMIPWVRRVFVQGQDIKHFHDAPDSLPPLDFIMEFLSFFAAAQVPLGLMLLGGTIASLKLGKVTKGFWKTLILICLFKLALLPIIACGWIHRIREIGWISKDDSMTPIVLAVAAGTPSATVQIYLTLAWIDPTKESVVLNCLAISLMAQYAFLPISMTFLMTYVIMHWV